MKPISLLGVFLSALSACSPATPTDAGAGVDAGCASCTVPPDKADAGVACAAQQECLSAFEPQPGASAPVCSGERACLARSYMFDQPLPACLQGRCEANAEGIRLRFEVDISAVSLATNLRSLNTRFVFKTALDGSALSCDSLRALAPGTTAAEAGQLETSRKLNFLAFDVSRLEATSGTTVVAQPVLHTGVGAGFLVWTEVWTGFPDSDSRLPTGTRLGFGCGEGGAALTSGDNWPAEGATPTSRTLRAKITTLN